MNTIARLVVLVPAAVMMAFLALFTLALAPLDWRTSLIAMALIIWPLALIVWTLANHRNRRTAVKN